jgi:hypothetical protein
MRVGVSPCYRICGHAGSKRRKATESRTDPEFAVNLSQARGRPSVASLHRRDACPCANLLSAVMTVLHDLQERALA